MKNFTIRVLLLITATVGIAFSFWYLIDHQMYMPQLTDISKYARFINHGLFIFALFLLIYSFFIKKRQYKFFSVVLIISGLLYLMLTFSFIDPNYLYLIPILFYLLSGFVLFNEAHKKNK